MRPFAIFGLVAGLATGVASAGYAAGRGTTIEGRASVIDGDTLEIHGQRIRLWGIDAPEARQTCQDAARRAWSCGRRAAFATSDLVGERTVHCVQADRDRYGRPVARCSVGGADLAGALVRAGWALDWPDYSHGAYARDERVARNRRAGVWAGTFKAPWEWRRERRR